MGISGPMFVLGVSLVPGPFWGIGMSGGMSKGVGHVWGQVFPGGMGMSRGWVSTPPNMGPGIQQDTVGKRAVRILLEYFLVIYCQQTAGATSRKDKEQRTKKE